MTSTTFAANCGFFLSDRNTVTEKQTAPTRSSLQEQLASFVLWIDGVGGYLVCMSHRLTIGQANVDPPVDIALLADVSRHHATIQRDPEGYFLEAVRKVQINGQATEKALLRSADRITLGNSCQLQFWQPVPVSTTARLDMVSGHRFAESVQATILMSDTLVIGPSAQSHVQVADMTQPLIMYRCKQGLAVRWSGKLEINGQAHVERGPVDPATTRLSTEEITLALERVK